jgi:ariadne-1
MSADDEWFDDFENTGSEGDDDTACDFDDDVCCSDDLDDDRREEEEERDVPLPGEPPEASVSRGRPPYTIITRESLKEMQGEALEQVRSILGCCDTTARALLTYFSWDAESVLGTLAERGEEEVYRRAGILSRAPEDDSSTPQQKEPSTSFSQKKRTNKKGGNGAASRSTQGQPQPQGRAFDSSPVVTCGVCFCDVPKQDTLAMSCGHRFCSDCWLQHVSIGVNEGMSRRLRCMAPGCGVLCNDDTVRQLLGNRNERELLRKFNDSIVDGFVEDNRRVKWCPSAPHCGRAVRVNGDPHCDISCLCGVQFCFACGMEPHSPATCEMKRSWQQRIQDGTETDSWLRANTKSCPKCSKPVEKNGGCNLVMCRCGQAFCWLCGQATGRAHDWNSIHGHSCGAYREEAESRQDEAQRSLKRYLHYLTRFEAHLESLRFEQRAREDLEGRINVAIEAEAQFGGLSNFGWLQNAMEQLFLARRAMAHSYVFAFYVFGPEYEGEFQPGVAETNKALFEDKQGQLEGEVEKLADLVEKTPADEIPTKRLAIINLASSINARIVKLYDVIENEIAAHVAGRPINVAPYRGQRSLFSVVGGAAGGMSAAYMTPAATMASLDPPVMGFGDGNSSGEKNVAAKRLRQV